MERPKLATRADILAAIGAQKDLVHVEVTAENLTEMRRSFHEDIGPHDIVWRIPGTTLFGAAYCRGDDPPPVRVILRSKNGRTMAVARGKAFVLGDDAPYLLDDGSGAYISLISGRPH